MQMNEKNFAELKRKLERTQQELAKFKTNSEHLRKYIRQTQEENKKLRSHQQLGMTFHASFIGGLLNDNETSNQIRALRHLLDVGQKNGLHSAQYEPLLPNGLDRVADLVESEDAGVRKLSKRVLQKYAPQRAIAIGYQTGGVWRPIPTDLKETKIRDSLESLCDFEYDDVRLEQVVDDIRNMHRLDIVIPPHIDDQQRIAFNGHRVTIQSALSELLKPLGLTYVVRNQRLHVVKNDDRNRMSTLVYNIRGLLDDNRTKESLLKIATNCLGKESTLTSTGKYDLIVVAPELEHYNLAIAFAALNFNTDNH